MRSTGRLAAPSNSRGAQRKPVPRNRRWLWWVSRWSLPLYRLRLGWLLGRRFMLVTHRGRRSGRSRRTCVMVLRFDRPSGEAFVAAGSPRADWYRNIQASPAREVAIGARRFRPVQRFLSAEEIAELLIWSRDHQPFRARVQSRFFRWPWPASDEDLRGLGCSLGGVAFRPSTAAGAIGARHRKQREVHLERAAESFGAFAALDGLPFAAGPDRLTGVPGSQTAPARQPPSEGGSHGQCG
jgi:deazaflavin-dependent oxidoreductase (nitroreductase family)